MKLNDIIRPENLVYEKPRLMDGNPMHYHPDCSHGVAHKLIAEIIADMGLEDKTIGISSVGCTVFAYDYLDIDWTETAHGRTPAIASAIKRLNPEEMIFMYQGDNDLAAIGTAETTHAANRGENIVIVLVNSAIYGTISEQVVPATLEDMPTAACPYGRNITLNGYPLKIGDLLTQLEGTCLVTRQNVQTAIAVRKAKKMLRKAFENAMAGKGTSAVEFASTYSSGWKMTPEKANKWMEANMFPLYSLSDLKDVEWVIRQTTMKQEITIAGFGGQGVLSMDKILAYLGLMESKEVSWIPPCGPEQHGGTANIAIILSDERASSPVSNRYDIAIILSQPSMDKFESKVEPGGILIYDGYGIHTPVKRTDINIYRVDVIDATTKMKNEKAFNVLILGGLLNIAPTVQLENVMLGLKKSLPERHHHLLPVNEAAIKEGIEIIQKI